MRVTRRQIWHASVQESIRTIAGVNNENLELPEKLPIEKVAKQAFLKLGNGGIICPGKEQ